MTTLCIIDIQPEFKYDEALDGVVHQIKLAKRRKAGIIILEYNGAGYTDVKVLEQIDNYGKFDIATKNNDGGSDEFLLAATNNNFRTDKIRVCGVSSCWCVRSTVAGITEKFPNAKIEIVSNAIQCGCRSMASLCKNSAGLRRLFPSAVIR